MCLLDFTSSRLPALGAILAHTLVRLVTGRRGLHAPALSWILPRVAILHRKRQHNDCGVELSAEPKSALHAGEPIES